MTKMSEQWLHEHIVCEVSTTVVIPFRAITNISIDGWIVYIEHGHTKTILDFLKEPRKKNDAVAVATKYFNSFRDSYVRWSQGLDPQMGDLLIPSA